MPSREAEALGHHRRSGFFFLRRPYSEDRSLRGGLDPDNLTNRSDPRRSRKRAPGVAVMTGHRPSIPNNSNGHKRRSPERGHRDDETVEALVKMALRRPPPGATSLGPSDNERSGYAYGAIRAALEEKAPPGRRQILSVGTAKYASAFNGPFRDFLSGAPRARSRANKKTYRWTLRNGDEAMRSSSAISPRVRTW